ncbi:MAG: GAF domain-containing protein [Erysipelotrichaceae bacterium]|nr:GAF domain-containing protein [Erysipelotrichaceae bacterium]
MDDLIVKQAKEFLDTEDTLSAMCNITSLLYHELGFVNWVGYYFYKNGKLSLGPFQGKVACSSIPVGKGVCGTAFQKKMLMNIIDVTRFEGHIACDPDSKSELVVPLIYENKIFGVLDIDSDNYRRFGSKEEDIVSAVADLIAKKLAGK